MTGREWQPGDVAMVPGVGRIMFMGEDNYVVGDCGRKVHPGFNGFTDVRRLAVIDPEDRAQVERLAALHYGPGYWSTFLSTRNSLVEPMRAALREFASPQPVKPEEPTGLGAVVEDADGVRWVRVFNPDVSAGADVRWASGACRENWSDVDVVRVLSEGIS